MRRALPLLVLAALAAALAVPQAASAAPDQVVITGDVNVARGETVGDVVVVDGRINAAGRIDGDVVAVSGPVRISGRVDGTITAVSDRVTLLPGAHVTGDLIYGDERPVIARSAIVDGEISDEGWADLDGFPWGVIGALSWWLAVSISTLVLGLIAVALAPRAAEAVVATARDRIGVSIAVGFALLVALPVLAVLALISLVGVPLGLGVLLALVPLGGLAYVAAAYVLGRMLVKSPASGFVAFLAGWAVLRALALIPVAGALVWVAAVVVGLGALVVAMWRSRGAEARPEAPAPPPRVPEPA
jgi:cytoskeletal protein CcmA (bactofilin family)